MHKFPSDLGFQIAPEWHHHKATWISWPHKRETWPGNSFDKVPSTFANIIHNLSAHEEVRVIVADESMKKEAINNLKNIGAQDNNLSNIIFLSFPTNDVWCRDYAPSFLLKETSPNTYEKATVVWNFNSWGNKYPPFDLDNDIASKISSYLNHTPFTPNIVLEGGSIDTNGDGCLLTTTTCLLNPNRNPDLSKEDIKDILKKFLSVEKIFWLDFSIKGDDTDGHIDNIARFVSPSCILAAVEKDPIDENYHGLLENLKKLKSIANQYGKSFDIIEMPMPSPITNLGERLPASYLNFYIANNIVLVPTYQCSKDDEALKILQKAFPNRHIQSIDCTSLVAGLGSIHCVTHEEPNTTA